MELKIFDANKLLSAWIISSIFFFSVNVLRADNGIFECGIQSLEDSSSDSLSVRQYEYPWKAAIFKVKENKFFGAGNLVNKNTVLTMAHMMKQRYDDNDLTKNLTQLKIVLGLRNLNDAKETGRKEFTVKKIVVHPKWSTTTDSVNYDGDIAIITLTEDVTFNEYIRPICLPDDSIASITTGETSSWAYYDSTRKVSEIPRRNEIQIIGEQECLRKEPDLSTIMWPQSFCAGAEGYSFCIGSSANGFYVHKDGKFFLRGMVSSSANVDCGEPNIAILADVLMYRDFLEENNVSNFTPDVSHLDEDCGVSSAIVGQVSHGESFQHGLLPWLAALTTFGCDVELHLMNEILAHTQRWCSLNEVVLNASKTKALIISDKTTDRTTELIVNGEQIEICKEARNLGYIMNSSFKSDSHVSTVANSIKFTVAMLRQSQNITPFSARVKLVKALIIPKILYCSNIYGKMSSTSASELKVAFNSAIRYIHKKVITHSKKDSTSKEVLQFLSTSNVNTFIMAHMCIFLHRLQRTAQPKYLHSILLKRRRLNILDPPEFTNSLARKDFFFIGPWEWNRLPANVRSEISADKFRQKCLSFYASVHEWNELLV